MFCVLIFAGILLSIVKVGYWNGVEATHLGNGVCSRIVGYTEYYHVYVSDRAKIYTVCGLWDCCRCSKWTYRSVLQTRSRTQYRVENPCCNGFSKQPDGHCQPVCRPACRNGGTCVDPGVCTCPEGTTGSRCEIPVCSFGCANGGRCTAPNTCTCATGWTGHTCETFIEVDEVFMLQGVTYASGSTLLWNEIGEGENALLCTTTYTDCCGIDTNGYSNVNDRRGQFYYADGTPVPIRYYAGNDGLYRERGYQKITLQRLSSATSLPPNGWYRCDIPDRNGTSHNIYINIVKELPTLSPVSSSTDLAKFQIIVSGVDDCQEWKADTNSTIVRYKSKEIIEKIQDLSQVNVTFNEYVDVSLHCD